MAHNNTLINFNKCKKVYKGYQGSDEKRSILIDNEFYMIKIGGALSEDIKVPTKADVSAAPFSEYISCHIFNSVGIEAQVTLMGLWDGKPAVACKDFIENHPIWHESQWQLQEFSVLENSLINSSERKRTPKLANVEKVLNEHPNLESIRNKAIERFWDTLIVDSLVGNFDRHSGNWGYVSNINTGQIELAPVYDCGATLYPKLADSAMKDVLADPKELNDRIMSYPNTTVLIEDKKIPYHAMLTSGHPDCDKALLRIYPRIDIKIIDDIIVNTLGLSNERKNFLRTIVPMRYEMLLQNAYKQLSSNTTTSNLTVTKAEPIQNFSDRANVRRLSPEEDMQAIREANKAMLRDGVSIDDVYKHQPGRSR